MLLRAPLKDMYVTSPYGPRNIGDGFHDGLDLRASVGTEIFPLMDECYVMKSRKQDMDAWGKYIVLYQPRYGLQFIYSHLSEVFVEENQLVYMDELIGLTGNTGASTGPHLHMGIYISSFDDIFDKDPDNGAKHKYSVDPQPYFNLIPSDLDAHDTEGYVAMIRAINNEEFQLNNKVRPNDPITRKEIAIILDRIR
jgi:murein DD-endopeptidase MepM/ murein hydrolase activator NlpD